MTRSLILVDVGQASGGYNDSMAVLEDSVVGEVVIEVTYPMHHVSDMPPS